MISETPTPRPDSYEEFFGFADAPFSLSANPRFRFPSAAHEDALLQVMHALQRREPVIVVTGDIGLGKTLLCRTVLDRLPRKTFLSVITDPLLDPDDLLRRILADFGVISTDNAGSIRASRHELAQAMTTFLATLAPLGAHAVVLIDEAQHLRPDVLEQIRLLGNTGDNQGTLLQIVLVGQPSLQRLLAAPELQQVRQRVTRCVSLSALTDDEVKQYIAHRLAVAREAETDSRIPGAYDLARALAAWNESSRPVTFTEDAIEAAARASHGVPRLVNVLCDRALEIAFEQRSRTVDAQAVAAAARLVQLGDAVAETAERAETAQRVQTRDGSRSRRSAAIVGVLALAAAVVWLGVRAVDRVRGIDRQTVQSPPPQHQPSRSPVSAPIAAPAPALPQSGAVTPAPAAIPNAPVPDAAGETDDSVEIVVASFRTDVKAAEVVDQLAKLGQPVHQRSIGGWQQVVAGPFASRAAAEETQRQLDRQGFTGTHVVRASR